MDTIDNLNSTPQITYFGLPVIRLRQGSVLFVCEEDIKRLPFYAFWLESARGSTMMVDDVTQETYVYLHDWEAFSRLLIKTGKHRFQL